MKATAMRTRRLADGEESFMGNGTVEGTVAGLAVRAVNSLVPGVAVDEADVVS
jgi:hypothetical protein